MARKEIPGFNVPFEDDDRSGNSQSRDNNRRSLLNIPGIGVPLSQSESKDNRRSLLNIPGIGVPLSPSEAELEKAQQRAQNKADAQAKKAQRKQNKQTFQQEKTAAKNKTAGGLFAAILGAATANPAVTAAGVGTAVDGMTDTIKARQNRRARKKDPYYNPSSEKQGSSQSSGFVKVVIDLFKVVFGQKKTSTNATQAPSPEPTMNGGFDMSDFDDDDIVDGEFTVIDDGRPKQLTSGKKS